MSLFVQGEDWLPILTRFVGLCKSQISLNNMFHAQRTLSLFSKTQAMWNGGAVISAQNWSTWNCLYLHLSLLAVAVCWKLKTIETVKWFKRSKWWKLPGVPLSWRLVLFNDGHNGYKRWFACFVAKNVRSIICGLLIESRKGFEVFFFASCIALYEFTVASFEAKKGGGQREFKIPQRRRPQEHRLKSEFAFFQSLYRLLQLIYFVKCKQTLFEPNS